MFNFFTLLPFFIFIISSYYFNKSKSKDTKHHIFLFSLQEATLSYLIVYLLFLQGFLSIFVQFTVIFLLILILAYFIFIQEKDLDDEWDLQLETIKNNLVLFMLTILALYVFLTIFRYLDPCFQIPLAILITALIFYLSIVINKLLSPTYKKIAKNISLSGPAKYIFLWLILFFILISHLLLQLPTNKISESLNLSNNVKYLHFDGFPTQIQNNFHQEEIIQIHSDYHIDSEITDYYYDSTHLYVYTNQYDLIVYDLSTKEVVLDTFIGNISVQLDDSYRMDDNELYNKFAFYDGHLILLGEYGTYLLTTDTVTKISDVSSYFARYYYQNNELYILNRASNSIFEIYKFNNGEIILTETIDLNTTTYDNLLVISENFFYEENNKYVIYEDSSISFNTRNGLPIYDKNKKVIYYTEVKDNVLEPNITIYQRIDVNGEISKITLDKMHNSKGIIIDENIYFTEYLESDINRIEIMNSNLEFDAIFNHLELQPFWITNIFSNSYIVNYQEKDNNLEFLQVEQNNKNIVLRIFQLQERNVHLELPFYTHYGIGIFIPIIIAFFIPITNYRKSITYISFEEALKKEENN